MADAIDQFYQSVANEGTEEVVEEKETKSPEEGDVVKDHAEEPAPQPDPENTDTKKEGEQKKEVDSTDWKAKYAELESKYKEMETKFTQASELLKKSIQPKDQFIEGIVKRYNAGEDLTPYIQAKTVNYDEMTPSQLLIERIKKEYPDATPEQLDKRYKYELKKYKQGSDDEFDAEEKEMGLMDFNKDAARWRNEFKEMQSQYMAPPPQEDGKVDEQTQNSYDQWVKYIDESPVSKHLKEKKSVPIKHGDAEFYLPVVDANELIEDIYHPYTPKLAQALLKEDGNADVGKMIRMANYVMNEEAIIAKLIEIGKEMAKKEIIEGEQGRNTSLSEGAKRIPPKTGDDEAGEWMKILRN